MLLTHLDFARSVKTVTELIVRLECHRYDHYIHGFGLGSPWLCGSVHRVVHKISPDVRMVRFQLQAKSLGRMIPSTFHTSGLTRK